MTAQLGSAIALGYGPQGRRQTGSAVLLSYSPPEGMARRLATGFGMPWVGGRSSHQSTRSSFAPAREANRNANGSWEPGEQLTASSSQRWALASKAEESSRSPWGEYLHQLAIEPAAAWLLAHSRDVGRSAPWTQFAEYLHLDPAMQWLLAMPADVEKTTPWGEYGGRALKDVRPAWERSKASDETRHMPWFRFSRPLDPGWGVVIPPGGIGPDDPLVIVPVKRTYVTINSLTLTRIDGAEPIPALSFGMSLDVDSWTWQWQATLHADALPLITPDASGQPVQVTATINGVPYQLSCEGYARQREFASDRISVKGRGRAALLDAPYAPAINYANSAARTAQQLMADVLTINNASIGWDVDWGITDWLVPAGVWTHQGPYISAVLDIASAVGAYVQPHDTAATLRILPRYPAAPWAWSTLTPDFELPSDVVAVEGTDWQQRAAYNRVYVAGTTDAGVLGQVTRAGTAGDLAAPMATHALITHADAARQRGLAELSNTGRQAMLSLRLPVLAETGVIKPGAMVRYVDAGVPRLGMVRGTQVEWARPTLRQVLAVETHV